MKQILNFHFIVFDKVNQISSTYFVVSEKLLKVSEKLLKVT